MMKRQSLAIWRDANRLLVVVEKSVKSFTRYHKYTLGADLRRSGMTLCQGGGRALRSKGQDRRIAAEQLILAIDDMKVLIQLGRELKAFVNFKQFQQLVELAVAMGKQSGAWLQHFSRSSRPEADVGPQRG